MSPLIHLVISLVLVAIMFPWYGWMVVFILFGGVLVDIDHYLWYLAKGKGHSIRGCYKYYELVMEYKKRSEIMNVLFVFHTLEFFLIIAYLSFYWDSALLFFIGLCAHVLPDAFFEVRMWKEKVVSVSVIFWIFNEAVK